ncbi:hypothetical protein RFI_29719 [Reticulomyxa filosa]|uniref:Uncharacterized protein n=1 Tax=Reticulomyxa filosa TaxID=46433 RepID=X6M250_RETFI|nr:hypothetical protein RFI_29719 [Reticulomyxa filosa]|eukprot:ETO07671.1 hypothetical protein RFI_29719 [Reticulomyxa filosa]
MEWLFGKISLFFQRKEKVHLAPFFQQKCIDIKKCFMKCRGCCKKNLCTNIYQKNDLKKKQTIKKSVRNQKKVAKKWTKIKITSMDKPTFFEKYQTKFLPNQPTKQKERGKKQK